MITNIFEASCHPAFQEIWDKIPERGMRSPFAYVIWHPPHVQHGHAVLMGNPKTGYNDIVDGGSIEAPAEELAEMVGHCSTDPNRHKGHIKESHYEQEQELAYKDAIEQLQTLQYDRMAAYKVWLVQMNKKWGGPMPAAAILPITSTDEWNLMVTDFAGDVQIYELPGDVALQFKFDIEPGPNVVKDETVGFKQLSDDSQTKDQKLRSFRKLGESQRRRNKKGRFV